MIEKKKKKKREEGRSRIFRNKLGELLSTSREA
jgi:hypothetical protein